MIYSNVTVSAKTVLNDTLNISRNNIAATPISAAHWFHRPYSAPSHSFDRVSKQPSVKADMAIYSHMYAWCVWTVLECGFNVKL